jgi:hypothetical protein
VYEDVGRVLKIRALDEAGKLLNDTRQTGFTDSTSRPRTLYLSLRQPIKDAVSLEYTFAEDTEQVAIPFEAQVDIGVAKAGPIEVLGAKARGGSSSPLERPWPPPPKAGTNQVLPPSRAAFVPSAEPNRVSSKNKNITVDLFSLTVGKSPPNELSATRWNNPPSPALQAAGFTIARLMLSAPGATIISVPPDGVTITKFEDDKGTKLSTVVFRDQTQATGYSRRSPDGQQSVVNVSLAAAPTPGATKCTIAGYLEARLAREERVIVAEKGELRKGARFDAGPFRIEVTQLRQVPPETPATSDVGAIEAWFGLYGPVGKVRLVEIADTRSEKVLGSRVITTPTPASDNVGFPVRLNTAPEGSVIVRVRYYDSDEIVRVPFDVTTGIGL